MEGKENLEIEKLQLEVAQLRNRWWTKSAYLGLLLPIIIAILSFLTAQSTGYFDKEKEKLGKEKEVLMAEVKILTERKSNLEVHISKIQNAHKVLQNSISKIVESRSVSGSAETAQQNIAFIEYRASYQYLIDVIRQDNQD